MGGGGGGGGWGGRLLSGIFAGFFFSISLNCKIRQKPFL